MNLLEKSKLADFNRKLILEDGSVYLGYGFGSREDSITEIVFNTSPVGYLTPEEYYQKHEKDLKAA